MKEALANIYRELSTGRIGRDEALDLIRALKKDERRDPGPTAGTTLLAEPAWIASSRPDGEAGAFPRRRVLLSGWARDAGDALAQGVTDVACLVVDDETASPAERFTLAALRGFAELRDLLDAGQGASDRGRGLVQWVVADDGDDARLLTGLDGLFESATLEQPNLCGQVVFVPKDIAAQELARLLAAEATTSPDRVVRHAANGRHVRRWRMAGTTLATAADGAQQAVGLRERGVYLITGGLGGLGLLVATHLRAHVPSATLVLCGRSAPQGAAADALARLQAAGGEHAGRVEYRQTDVGLVSDASALVAGIVRDHGALHGIFHGAGVLRDDFLQRKTADRFAEVLAPKVAGAVALDAASAGLDLDLFVLFGSIASWAGNLGQTDYAAANGFLDAFAGWRANKVARGERHGRSLTLAWPHWIEGGMHVDAESLRRLEQRTGLRSMDTASGLHALHAALAMPQPALMVMHGQQAAMLAALGARRRYEVASVSATAPASQAVSAGQASVGAPADVGARLRTFLREEFSAVLKIPAQRIELRAALEQYGIDSILAMSLTGRLEETFGVLPKTLFFEYQTIDELAGYFEARHADALARLFAQVQSTSAVPAPSTSAPATQLPVSQRAGRGRRRQRDAANVPSPAAAFATVDAPIAIVGLSGRYPQSPDLDAFWRNLRDGRDCISEVPSSRWDWAAWFKGEASDAAAEGAHLSRWGGFIEGVDEFDPRFFNISPREAIGIDPQERLFLQHAWLALEDAGLTRAALQVPDAHGLPGQVGVYAGVMYGEYSLSGSLASIANRVSYFLNLHGPSLTLDTMCSSSLTALHLACQDLRLGRTALALAGGVNVSVHPNKYTMLSGGQFISRDGHCQSFGEGGDGYIPGEGVGIAVLKRLADAERDGDRILGVIRATALNHGGKTNGYTVPNPQAQADVIARALREAGVDARHVSYIEAHGTGTKLGDPIEINALSRAFHARGGDAAQDAGWCLIGSAKSNIGHCESAAGIAGVTKVLLQMRHGQVVPSLHSRTLNPHIDFASTPFEVVQSLRPWQRPVVDGIERPRIAGISSFGAGGSNAHVLIEEYRVDDRVVDDRVATDARPALVPVSARTREQLLDRVRDLRAALRADGTLPLDALSWTLQTGREAMDARLAIVAQSTAGLLAALDAIIAGVPAGEGVHRANVRDHRDEIGALDDDRSALDRSIAEGDLARLAAWWAKGAAIDWSRLRAGRHAPRRVSLPGYPFARERYWRDPVAAAAKAALPPGQSMPDAASSTVGATAILHPLVHRNRSGLDGLRFESIFAAGDPLLVDGALPDATLPQMAIAALDLASLPTAASDHDGAHWSLEDVAWGVAASDVAGRALHVALMPRGVDEIALEIGLDIAPENHDADDTQVLLQAMARRRQGPRMAMPVPPDAPAAASGVASTPVRAAPIVATTVTDLATTSSVRKARTATLREIPLSIRATETSNGSDEAPHAVLGPVQAKPANIALRDADEVPLVPVPAKGRVRLAPLSTSSVQDGSTTKAPMVRLFDDGGGLRVVRIEAPLAECVDALAGALHEAASAEDLRVIRIEGTHPQAWQGGREVVDAMVQAGVFTRLAETAVPTLAVVAGDALGAGLLLASASTLLVANERAEFGFTDPDAALFPTAQEDAWFRARIGDGLADDLLYRRTRRPGRALRDAGWSARFVPANDVVPSADALCASLASKSALALGLLSGHLARELSPRLHDLVVAGSAAQASAREPLARDGMLDRDALCVSLCEEATADALLTPLFDAIVRASGDTTVASIVLACSAPGGLPDTLSAETLGRAIDAVVRSRVPVIAALDGDTGGAGWLLALACDAIVLRSDASCTTSMHWHDPALRNETVALTSLRLPAQLARRLSLAGGACPADALAMAGVHVADDALVAAQALAGGWTRWPEAVLQAWKTARSARHEVLLCELVAASNESSSVTLAPPAGGFASPVVDLALRDDGVAVIALQDREARNMFTPALVSGLRDAFAAAEASPDCRAIVITGYDSWFATGGTVETLLAIQDGQSRFTDETVFQRALDCPLPVIAAIQGHGIGGGWSFGMFADLVLLSAESRYLSPYMGYGFTPGAGSTMTFALRIGHDLARETLLTAEDIGGQALRERGVALPVLPRREVRDAAIALATAIASRPRAELVALKRLWTQGMRRQRDAVYARELEMHAQTFVGNADTLATIQARFATPQVATGETPVVPPVVVPSPAAPRASVPAIDAATLESKLAAMLAQELFLSADEIDPDAPFIDLGLDSITGVTWIRRINAEYGTDIEATKVYSHPTVRRLAALVIAELGEAGQGVVALGDAIAGSTPSVTAAPAAPAATAPTATTARPVDRVPGLVDTLRAMLAQELFLQPNEIDEDTPFIDLGLDSITGVTWVRRINADYGVDIEATQVYSHPTLRRLATLVAAALPSQPAADAGAERVASREVDLPVAASVQAQQPSLPVAVAAARPPLASWRSKGKVVSVVTTTTTDAMTQAVAIIGEAGRFPQAPDLAAFWRNLAEGRVCIGEVGPERWSLDAYYREGAPSAGFTNSKWLGALEDFDRFDPLFFNISPTEAESMDPQQRVFLQACWHALENAGRDPHALSGSRCGVFVGCGPSDYHQIGEQHRLSAQGFTGAATSILAARIAYFLDLRGPCVSIDTACSSSLVAIAQACDSLNSGQSDLALAGGVYVMGGPSMHIMTAQAGMLSADGRCHTFDADANGFVPGEGVGVVVLKRLVDAQRDGDRIDAVIEGWGVNQDGRSNGITAPNQDAQTALLQSVYRRFGIDPDGIQLIEAHGTGTKLGDPIEVAGLKAAFAPFTQRAGFCALGSVKSNIGHCLTAAGIAGVLKLVLSLRHRQLPPTVNFHRINEHIQLDGSPFLVNDRLREWSVPAGMRRRSAVSSFGFSGTNAHLVISESATESTASAAALPRTAAGPVLVPLSARTAMQLRESVRALRAWLDTPDADGQDLRAIARTLQTGRHAMGERVCFLVHDVAGLRDALDASLDERAQPGIRFEGQVKRDRAGLGLLLQDEDVRSTVVGKWLSERRHDRLGDVWAKGLDLDWRMFHPDDARPSAPVALPGYPFARDRHWLASDDVAGDTPARHPLLQENVSRLSGQRYRARLPANGADMRMLADGIAVVSPCALLDMARAAMADATSDLHDEAGQHPSIETSDVGWSSHVPYVEGVELRIDLFAIDDEEYGFEIRSDRSDHPHVQGRVAVVQMETMRLDLDALRARIPARTADPASLRRADHEALASIEVPAATASDRAWALHPLVAQQALAVAGGMLGCEPGAMPVALTQSFATGRAAPRLHAWIRHGDAAGSIDIDFLDDDGVVQARWLGLQSASRQQIELVEDVASMPSAAEEAAVHVTAPIWDSIGALDATADRSAGERVVAVNFDAGQREVLLAHYRDAQLRFVSLDSSDDVSEIARKLGDQGIDRLLWQARTECPSAATETGLILDGIVEGQSLGILMAFRIARALVALGYETHALRWDMIAPNSIPTHRLDAVDPTHAGLQGFSGSLAEVYPRWKIRLVDVPMVDDTALDGLDRLPALARNNCHALRGGSWFRQRLIEADDRVPQMASPYREGGIYVAIGGAGGIGEVWTRHVAERHRAQVVWIGRRALDESLQAKIDAIATVGPAPVYVQADATDETQLRAACELVRRRFPAVHGVVHSAVGAFDQSLKTITEADFRAVLAPKIDLSVWMAQVFAGEALDFAVFFSSNASFTRGAGMSGYSAGCSFKDAFAHCLAQHWPCPVKVVNWGYWSVGAGDAMTDAMKHYFHESGYRPLEAEEAMHALERLLAGDFVQLSITRHVRKPDADDQGDHLRLQGPATLPAPLDALRALDFAKAFAPFKAKAGAEMEPLLCRLLAGILAASGDVAPPFRRWRAESLAIVAAAGADDDSPLGTLWDEWNAAMAGWTQDAGRAALCTLVDACMRALPDILAGRRKPTDVIFPGSSLALVERVYKTDALSLAYNETLSETLVAAVRAQLAHAPGTRLRMLEIGAGTGATTVGILAKLEPYADRIAEYCYTDLSKAFLFHAETHYAPGAPYLRTRLFDVEKPLSAQGIDIGSYDVVIAANVIHATRNIRNTIRNAKALLRRDGLLLMNEISDRSISGHVTFGLLDGWWLNEDQEVRIPGSPGLYPDRWHDVLVSEGFHTVLFPCREAHFAGQQIVAAFADGVVRQRKPVHVPVRVPGASKLPTTAPARAIQAVAPVLHGTLVEQAVPVAGRGTATLRDEAVRFCKRMVGKALKLAEHEIDAGEPLERYGIDSIIVGLVNQELHTHFGDVGSTLLYEHQTIDALADHLLATQGQRLTALLAPSATVAPVKSKFIVAAERTASVQPPATKTSPSAVASGSASLRDRTVLFCKRMLGRALKLQPDEIDAAEPLESYGIDSIIVGLVNQELQSQFGDIGSTLLFEHRTVDALADHLLDVHRDRVEQILAPASSDVLPGAGQPQVAEAALPAAVLLNGRVALRSRGRAVQAHAGLPHAGRGPIAIVGISGMYPGADDLDAFWACLKRGYDGIGDIPSRRWSMEGFYEEDEHRAVELGMSYSKRGGFLQRFAEFDALFFGIPPREAMNMDPQERLFIRTAWHALENAGYTRRTLREDFQRRVGVFAGITRAGYSLYRGTVGMDEKFWPRTSFASVANRLSYLLDIQGPSLPVDTMCSSSLSAIHEACEHIHNGDCDVAIAGGANLYLHPTSYVDMSSQHMLSRDGVCKSFGEGANGFVPGEGVGVVILKPLARAEADGDIIHGVILASHVNHGGKTNGFTVPNPTAQAELVRRAIDKAGISARAIGYIEAHGTGTELGDPIEIAGLQQAFSRDTDETGFCRIGSAKSNIGHLEAAAGIAGLTKALLQLRHGQIVPSLHCERINPHIRFERTAFEVNRQLVPWDRPTVDGRTLPRIAGISSFGAGGANAHVLVQEYMPAPSARRRSATPAGGVLVPLSARSEEQLRQKAADLRDLLRASGDGLALADVAYTLQVGRESMEERLALLVDDLPALVAQLDAIAGDLPLSGMHYRGQVQRRRDAATAEAAAEALADALRARRLPDLARSWVEGAEIDWSRLYVADLPRRVELPGYPFARDEYWLDTLTDTQPAKARAASRQVVEAVSMQGAPHVAARSRDFGLIEDILERIEASAIDPDQGAQLLKRLV